MEWWIIGNAYGGWRVVPGGAEKDARGWVRDGIAKSFLDQGLSRSAARRAAQTYRVWTVAGGCTEQEARDAVDQWDSTDSVDLAQKLRERWCARTGRKLEPLKPRDEYE